MAKGAVVFSQELSFIDTEGISIETVELKTCDPVCPRVLLYQATEGAVVAYQSTITTQPLDGSAIKVVGERKGYKYQGICEHQDYCGSIDATRRRACFTK